MKFKRIDPVHYSVDADDGPGWYFWEETWAHRNGPYESEHEARGALSRYAEAL